MALMREVASGSGSRTFELGYGGAESNVLTQASRLGLRTRWVSSLGSDAFGQLISVGLGAEGVELIGVEPEGRQTGLMVKTYGASADPTVVYYRANSAASHLQLGPAQIDAILAAKFLHITGIFPALSGVTRRTLSSLLSEAEKRGVRVSFDVNYRPRLWARDEAADALGDHWKSASVVFGDREELALLCPQQVPDSDRELMEELSEGSRIVVLKRGESGGAVLRGDEFIELPAVSAEVVDTVGAGDAFVGGFLCGLCHEWKLRDCLQAAIFCGAKACEDLGDWEGQARKDQLDRYLTPERI